MAEKKAEVPANRCGFELQLDVMEIISYQMSENSINSVCCWRPVWESQNETDRCIWHADVDKKPLDELITARANFPERLEGAFLRNLHVEGDTLSLRDCSLLGVTFDGSNLRSIDLTDADLRWAKFTDADLIGADFTDADLSRADFTDANLFGADFIDADLPWADFTDADLLLTNLTDADLRWADFIDASLHGADFTDAALQDANLSDADARGTNFQHATLQDAVFTQADCREAVFTSALLYDTVFSDTRINSKTTFFDPETTFYDSITSRPGCVYEENSLTTNHSAEERFPTNHLPEEVQPLEAARWVYRRLETLHEENALSEDAREFHISKEEAERDLYWERGEYGPWGVKTLMWYLTRHGESVKRVLAWWGGVILSAGLLFAGLDGVKDATGTTYAIASLGELRAVAGWQDLLLNLYFSITTFSTIMDGGLAPAGNGTRAVVAVESITGALLVALLVFVLGRRVAR